MARGQRPVIEIPAGIREKRPGYWEVSVAVGYDAEKQRTTYRSTGVKGDVFDAIRRQTEFAAELEGSGDLAVSDPLLRALFNRVVEHLDGLGRSERTVEGYGQHMDALINGLYRPLRQNGKLVRLADFEGCACPTKKRNCHCAYEKELVVKGLGNIRLSALTGVDLQRFYTALSRSGADANTVARYHSTFRRALNLARKWKLTRENVALDTERPTTTRKQIRRPTDAEVADLVGASFDRSWDLGVGLQLACSAGPRRGEVIAARWRQLSGDVLWKIDDSARRRTGGGITVDNGTKTHAEREVTLDSFTVAMLTEHRERMEKRAVDAGTTLAADAFILSDAPDGAAPWNPDRLTRAVYELRAITTYRGRFQDLRGWSLSTAFDEGTDLADVVRRGGWGNASTFLTYYLRSAGQSDVAAAKSIGDRLAIAREQRVQQDELAQRRARKLSS